MDRLGTSLYSLNQLHWHLFVLLQAVSPKSIRSQGGKLCTSPRFDGLEGPDEPDGSLSALTTATAFEATAFDEVQLRSSLPCGFGMRFPEDNHPTLSNFGVCKVDPYHTQSKFSC